MRGQARCIALLAVCCAALPIGAPAQIAVSERIPLNAGLTLVEADPGLRGDEEAIYHVDAVTADGVAISMSNGGFVLHRFVRRIDLQYAHRCLCSWTTGQPRVVAGTTANGTSASVLQDLALRGSTLFVDMWRRRDPTRPDDVIIGQSAGVLYRATQPASVALLVNDRLLNLPVTHATGVLAGTPVEFYWFDQRDNPLLVHGDIGSGGGWLVKIYSSPAAIEDRLQDELGARRPATLFGVYFEPGTAQLRGESLESVHAIARVLHAHSDWRLRIAVHTDNLNGWDANLNLARLRAGALAAVLQQRYAIGPTHYEVIAAGAADPLGDNTTLSGRAMNRRLVITRL